MKPKAKAYSDIAQLQISGEEYQDISWKYFILGRRRVFIW